ncbi:FecR family protein [Paraflavitalea sp. CAU 1676]|uniref:FecR family protein n=1 Tax=Paraflavitalea sp. CAU 1676 TaxID=3032598 RepID=UPI0023D98D27|nr:FecR family protein [Paraflavitalea sp. CAU 1676]MDF2191471.1 FecR domain-containing protein [Paraflavitalea sp. CAU 1676]
MDQARLTYLIERYERQEATPAEAEELNAWFHDFNPGRNNMDAWLREQGGEDAMVEMLYADFRDRVAGNKRVVRIRTLYKVAAAAAVVGIVMLVLFRQTGRQADMAQVDGKPSSGQTAPTIKPGSDKATLTLADGSTVTLGESNSGTIATQSNAEVAQVQQGKIAYKTNNGSPADLAPVYNTLKTPRGGKYNLTLSDGTEVTLDAASSITYPVAFNGSERVVEITGQVFFEVVHKASQPFRVKAKGQLIEDLGTAFNVSAYDDDDDLRVTLAEGRVDVHTQTKTAALVPGQQARIVNGQQSIGVKQVNVEEVVAWKNGWFMFRNETIQQVMKQAARWYDIEVEFEGAPTHKLFGGSISRYKEISELLQNLNITGGIKYTIEGKKIIIKT